MKGSLQKNIFVIPLLIFLLINKGYAQTLFAWPLQQFKVTNDEYSQFVITNYVDLDPGEGTIKDYACGARTYDGHTGTDIMLYPFPWYKMSINQVWAVAAAPGKIIQKIDGQFDQNCSKNNLTANQIVIQHSDGSKAYYLHLKKGTLNVKNIGDNIATGEFLGYVGSSGSSTAPHLHFEVRDKNNNVIDPFSGSCNNITSRWISQKPYTDSYINMLTTQSANVGYPACPGVEIQNSKKSFIPGETVYFSTFYRHILKGQVTEYNVYKPDNTLFKSWSWDASEVNNYSATWNRVKSYVLPADAPGGGWRFEALYNGILYKSGFIVKNCSANQVVGGNISGQKYYESSVGITSTASITGGNTTNVTFKAGDIITLNIGFQVTGGSNFNGIIGPCTNGGNKALLEESQNKISKLNETLKVNENVYSLKNHNFNTNSNDQTDLLKIYPNPFLNEIILDINLPETVTASIVLTDLSTGMNIILINKELFFKGRQHKKIETSELPRGVYAYKFTANKYTKTGKLVKQ